jgi:SAM-dependent methyltransferase
VIFFNSLHHVDTDGMAKALKEAARVLRHGGLLLVSEPMAEGPYFELMKPVHDETEVRQYAQEVLRRAPEYGLLQERVLTHVDTVRLKDFDAFHDRITTINPDVRERFLECEEELRANFERLGQPLGDGWAFDQPTRVHLFRRS